MVIIGPIGPPRGSGASGRHVLREEERGERGREGQEEQPERAGVQHGRKFVVPSRGPPWPGTAMRTSSPGRAKSE